MIPSILFLSSSSPTGMLIWCVIGLCAGTYLFAKGFRLLQRRQLILNTPVSKIRSASMGMVELSGLAVGPYTMVAPVTERACYYYRTVVWEWRQNGKNKQWTQVAAECMHLPFFLDDNTGKVMVDPRGAELDLHCDFEQEFCDSFFTTKEEVPSNVRTFLARHGINTDNKIKVKEFCVKPKNALFILGTLDENRDLGVTPQPIYDAEAATGNSGTPFSFSLGEIGLGSSALSFATQDDGFDGGPLIGRTFGNGPDEAGRLRQSLNTASSKADSSNIGLLTSGSLHAKSAQVIRLSPDAGPPTVTEMTQQQKIAAALVKAGISNPAAWAAAGVTPSAVVVNSDPTGSLRAAGDGGKPIQPEPTPPPVGFDQRPRVALMKGKNNPAFLISWRSQRDLARSLGWKCSLMIWGGPALALLSLYGLLEITHWL